MEMGRPSTPSKFTPYEVEKALKLLGGNIRRARIRRAMRQQDLAEKLGVSRQAVAGIEAGNPVTSISTYLSAIWALGLLASVSQVADPDADHEGKARERLTLPGKVCRKRKAGSHDQNR